MTASEDPVANVLKPGSGFIFMKVGTHAGETLVDIIDRKRKEIDAAGFALWGYGGPTCHPVNAVQPFARDHDQRGGVVYLCMKPMESRHFAVSERATELSLDKQVWEPIPPAIDVRGSNYALAIADLKAEEFTLPLSQTVVGIGPSAGESGDRYIRRRVDKGCLELVATEGVELDSAAEPVKVELVARLVEPYAVFVR